MSDDLVLFAGSVPEGYREYLEPVIFRPWAEMMISRVHITEGHTVLDVAAGTGVVSRAAAARAGATGRVVASDISAAMLEHVAVAYPPGGAPLETLVCSATALELPDESVDTVLCQQGLPFVPDRAGALKEMARVLRPGGMAGVAVWQLSDRVEPFAVYAEALEACGVPEPFPHAYDTSVFTMAAEEVGEVFGAAGFEDVDVRLEQLVLDWPSVGRAVGGIAGTPYGPVLAGLDDEVRRAVLDELEKAMTGPVGDPVAHVMVAVLASGRRPVGS
ncbi:MAG: class I SAM-dependent methyltransferase [Acidimicrobiales bacterium]